MGENWEESTVVRRLIDWTCKRTMMRTSSATLRSLLCRFCGSITRWSKAGPRPDYGRSCIARVRRRRMIAHFRGSRSLASNFFHVPRVNLSSLTRSIVATIRIKHSTTTGGQGLLCPLDSGSTGRAMSSTVDFGGERLTKVN